MVGRARKADPARNSALPDLRNRTSRMRWRSPMTSEDWQSVG